MYIHTYITEVKGGTVSVTNEKMSMVAWLQQSEGLSLKPDVFVCRFVRRRMKSGGGEGCRTRCPRYVII